MKFCLEFNNMVDKITKSLNKFSKTERELIKNILLKIKSGTFDNLDIKKLKGRDDVYRVRKGKIRIIYRFSKKEIYLLVIEKRNDKTYKNI